MITASEPSWITPFAGLSPRCFGKLLTTLRRDGADVVHRGRPWSLPLEDRVLLVLWPERFAGKLAASGAVHRKAEDRPRTGRTR
ncbi:IS5/IS1182 family transposase, partial [Streptomyces sp. NPDC001455]